MKIVEQQNSFSSELTGILQVEPTLGELMADFGIDCQADIPLIVRFLENPASPCPLPGEIDLFNHDCLHLLLQKPGVTPEDEAFIVGFSMGSDERTRAWHCWVFKLFSLYFYPKLYKLTWQQLREFDQGLAYGRSLKVRNINLIDFRKRQFQTIAQLRAELLGLSE